MLAEVMCTKVMASSWRYPQRSDEDRQLTSFRLPMCNHPPISPSSPPHSLTALPTKTKKRQRGGPRGEMVGRQVSEVIPKMETSHSLVALPQLKGGEEKSDRGWERHDSKGDYCKVVNLRIPLLPYSSHSATLRLGGGKETKEIDLSPHPELNTRPSVPTLSKVELVAFGGDRVAPLADNEAQRLATGSPMYASSFLSSLAYQRRDSFSLRRSSLPRHPHPSTAYPDLSLSCTKLNLPHPALHPRDPALGDCVLRFSHRSIEHDISSRGGLQMHLAELRLLNPQQLVQSFKYRHSVYHCPVRALTSQRPPLGSMASCELYCKDMETEKEPLVAQAPRRRRSIRSSHAFTVPRVHKEKGTYPDPLESPPHGYQRRLAQLAVLVSETITWEARRRMRKKSRTKASGSHGSM